jgi:hypothetical protein
MRYRNVYIRKEGESMQRRSVGKAIYYLVMIVALVSAFTLVACGGDDGDDGEVRTVSNQSVPVNSSTVQAVTGQPFTIPNGSAFSPGLPATPVTLTFNSPSTFTLTPSSGGGTASGTVAFASCTFTVTSSTIAGLATGQIPTFSICNFLVTATTPLEEGGASGQGTVSLQLGRNGVVLVTATLPTGVSITVSILDDGTLVINGINTGILPPPTTGSTGTGGTP